ncbi:IS3 family transposase [Limnobaculum parvum]|uniref:IS3 family transposase n=1 Tax=Limnobaculum parvum TaxID=2172103 RepID=A0A2Y9U0S4_9GAMM|nr:IS3 family transposase [Limnobaculum parvum]AWH89412.1 IS3 family transposase [Limnobaculum parvum]
MKKIRFTETQIVNILKLADSGIKVDDICRQNSISSATYYNWKSKYGGMEAADIKRIKELEEENTKLKKMFADVSLENHAMKELFGKKGLVMTEKKSCAKILVTSGLSVIKACKMTALTRSVYYRQCIDWKEKDSLVITAIQSVLAKSPQAGFWKCYFRLRFQGYHFNHKRVYRVYCRLGLNLRRRVKKILPKREKQPLSVAKMANAQWALDFMHDALYCGKRFRTLNILDEGTRECLAIEIDTSLPAERVIRVLERLKEERGLPKQIRVDNGPELISINLLNYCEENNVKLVHIQPGKPTQNGFIERFNGSFRREFLNAYLFDSLSQVREMAWFWQQDYNDERTHESLGNMPPTAYRKQLENSNNLLS